MSELLGLLAPALPAAALMAVAMAGLWAVQRRTHDAGVVDVGWTYGVGACAILFAALSDGEPARRTLVAALVAAWSLRLGTYILRDRVLSGPEDGRYQDLRSSWGDGFQRRIFWFFQAQGVLAVVFALPALAAMASRRGSLGWVDAIGVAVWLVAITGESVADRQLALHRADPANRGRTCRRGLWRWSRHPNYFFEWLHWWSYAVVATGGPLWWIAAAAPLVMLVFILFVTGIPPTEARAVASRGDDYRQYQRTTSAFVPWPPGDPPRILRAVPGRRYSSEQ
jgi:steroid 5-alpha reductase family enzyme